MDNKKLGRGLDAIFNNTAQTQGDIPLNILDEPTVKKEVVNINISEIHPNRYQPRVNFVAERLEDLKQSIKNEGVIQPVLVRKSDIGYELIAGERRFRASKELNYTSIPAIVISADDTKALQLALIENIQRDNLNAIEKAKAFQMLIDKFKLTQEKIADYVTMERSSISNFLRLLELPIEIQDMVSRETISMGHARALLGIESKSMQHLIAQRVIGEHLSVRQVENIVTRIKTGKFKVTKKQNPQITELEDQLRKVYGTRVAIKKSRKKGHIMIEFYTDSDFDRIFGLLKNAK